MAPEHKVAAAIAFAGLVALTPRSATPVFAAAALILLATAMLARLPARFVARRASVVVPFIAFASIVPFVSGGERTEVLGVSLSEAGLASAAVIATKALLGVSVSVILAGTTEAPEIVKGLQRLGVPSVLTSIAAFMLRYLEIVTNDLSRMRTAMTARAHDPRWLWQSRPIANASAALFVRSYERGERVHLAMLSRGFDGTIPDVAPRSGPRRGLATALAPAMALLTSLAVWAVWR